MMYAAAAGVKRSRQAGQQTWVMAVLAGDSSRADRPRTRGRPGSSQGWTTARHPTRSTRRGARDRTRAECARTGGSCRSASEQPCLMARAALAGRSVWRWPFGHRLAAEAAALVQPTLGVRGVAFGIATRNE